MIKVNENCIGCQQCVMLAPDIFEMSNDVSTVKKGKTLTEENKSILNKVRDHCPVQAISF